MPLDLIGMPYSPYTEKARWALDHHHIGYRFKEHVPMIGELLLRARVGKLREKASVPMLVSPHGVVRGSFAIARHADRVGGGPRLIPDEDEIARWDEKSATALDAGRALFVARALGDREALQASLPGWIPRALRGASTPLAAMATRYVGKKYGALDRDRDEALATVRAALEDLRKALGGRETILDDFSYADITMAVLLQGISPVADEYIRLRPAARRAWTEPALAGDFSDLVAWRDALYAKHRRS